MPFSSDIANDLLWTPFDNKCVNSHNLCEKITPEIFLEKCYSNPFFEDDNVINNIGSEIFSNDDSIYMSTMDIYAKNEKRNQVIFQNWINSFDNQKIYTISGNSGTGKTTYIHHMKQIMTNYEWTIIDMTTTPSSLDWIGDTHTNVEGFSRAARKTFAAILHEIHNILFNESSKNNKIEKIYNNLKSVLDRYNETYANQFLPGEMLLSTLCNIFKENSQNEIQTVRKAGDEFARYFNNSDSESDYDLIDKALNVLLLILRCYDDNEEKKHIIVFDNFERFITMDEIYNNEINDIRIHLASYSETINKENNHNLKIKFIMALRCSTARRCGIMGQSVDENPSNVDISSWFFINDIIYKKEQYYKDLSIENNDFSLVRKITGDFRKCPNKGFTGLQLFLSPLFNDNKRLIIDFVGMLIEDINNVERYDYKLYLQKYQENWDIDTDIARCAARNIIKGLILYKLKNTDNLFKNMKVIRDKDESDENNNELDIGLGLGLVRKILTIVYNKSMGTNSVLLSDVIATLYSSANIFEQWKSNEFEERRKSISSILFAMTSYNRRKNDWIQFLDLQHSEIKKKLKISNEEEMNNVLLTDFSKFRITIMPAGIIFLLHIIPSFEYFSVRYNKHYQPLFATVPTLSEMNDITEVDGIKKLSCYRLIDKVKTCAFRCMNQIKDSNLKITLNNRNKTHRQRIIAYHCSYMDNFIQFIQENYIKDEFIDERIKNNYNLLVAEIEKIKEAYHNFTPRSR